MLGFLICHSWLIINFVRCFRVFLSDFGAGKMPSPQDFYGFYPRKVFVDYLLAVQAAQMTEANPAESDFPSAFRKTP